MTQCHTRDIPSDSIMAPTKRGGRPPSSTTASKSSSSFRKRESDVSRNVSGYQKRQERKATKSRSSGLNDLYEYNAGKNRRAHVEMQLDPDELGAEGTSRTKGSLPDDDADDRMEALRRKISANINGEFGVVESEDDEELDSDEAFEGDSDEERFGNFKFAERVRLFLRLSFITSAHTMHAYPLTAYDDIRNPLKAPNLHLLGIKRPRLAQIRCTRSI